jgi:integrase
MGAVSIRALVQSAVDALKDAGANEKLLNVYACTGFGELRRRVEARGVTEYSAELAGVVVREVRAEFEGGAVSSWKCTAVRDGAALLDVFHRTGTLDLPPLSPWNELRLPPTPEQLAEDDNLHALVWVAQQLLRDKGLSAKTLHNYHRDGFHPIVRAHQEQGLTGHSPRVTAELLARSRVLLENGAMCPSVWRGLRTCAAVLEEVAATGRLEPRIRYQPRWGLRQPGQELKAALDRFRGAACEFGWAEGTIAVAHSAVRQFLFAVEDAGITTVGGLTRRVVSDAVTVAARRRAGGLGTWLFAVRGFLKHLHAVGATGVDLSTAVPQLSTPHRVVREGFTAEEVRTLLASGEDSVIDKRDRAIMTLAAQTGLRASDLARLRRGDIDWRTNEIRIVQAKTGRALCLPLEADSGNAIADYLLSGRVPGDSPYLFVCCGGPIRPLSGRTMSAVVTRRMRRCGLHDRVPRRGAHSFRRGLGTRMLKAEIPIDTLQQVLGHKHIDSARPYLSVSESGLRDCAISLAAAVEAGERS